MIHQSLTCKDMLVVLANKDFSIIGLDTETNGEDCRDERGFATGISIAVRLSGGLIVSCYFPFRHALGNNESPETLDALRSILGNLMSDGFYITCHNIKFDLVSLATLGINWTGNFYCTLQMCHLINENFPYEKSLNNCVKTYIDADEGKTDIDLKLWVKAVGWAGVPTDIMRPYAEYDAVLHLVLFETIIDRFKAEITDEYWVSRQAFTRTIIKMESRGVKVDVDLCNKQAELGRAIMGDITETFEGNLGSTIFLGKILLDELGLPVVKRSIKTQAPSFDKFAMEIYDEILERTNDPTAIQIRTYRGWQKSVTSNYEPYVRLLSADGRLRPNYKLHGTRTGRLSCSLPNLQQIPKVSSKPWNGKMKSAFIPEEGYELWEFDYSQLELRLATAYANESGLKQIFEEGRDIFTEMSLEVGMSRFDTKTMVYTIQYGGGIKRLSNVFGVSSERAAELRNNFYSSYPGFRTVTNLAAGQCRTKGSVSLWSKRRRHFLYKNEEGHKAFNAVCQGGAADIVSNTMNRLMTEIDDDNDCRMLLQIHDSVLFELKIELVEEYLPKIKAIMEDVQPDFKVRFQVEGKKWT